MVRISSPPVTLVYREPLRLLAVPDTDESARAEAASGWSFSLLARLIRREDSNVHGVKRFGDGTVRHLVVRDRGLSSLVPGPRYAQGNVDGVFGQPVGELVVDRRILFTGVLRQCAAFFAGLTCKGVGEGIEICDNLPVYGFACHDTPQPMLFLAHRGWLLNKNRAGDGIHGCQFRSKPRGCGVYCHQRGGKRCVLVSEADNDRLYHAVLLGRMAHTSCDSCKSAPSERMSDVAIGGYRGIVRYHLGLSDPKRVLLMLMTATKGGVHFDGPCVDSGEHLESSFELASRENFDLVRPALMREQYGRLSHDVEKSRASGDLGRQFGQALTPFSLKRALKSRLPPAVLENSCRLMMNRHGGNRSERTLLGVAGWQTSARRRPHRVACPFLSSLAPLCLEGNTA